MFFLHKCVLEACQSNLDDPEEFERTFRSLVGNHPAPGDYRDTLRKFLKDLPPPATLKKIVSRFRRIAKDHGATIRHFRWWEIVPRNRALMVQVIRDGQTLDLVFIWKKAGDGSKPSGGTCGYYRDKDCANGWRAEFDYETYQEVRAAFDAWLARPLALPTP